MIVVRLSFKDNHGKKFDIVDKELLSVAVERALTDVPLGKFKPEEVFHVTVNGLQIEKDFWKFTKILESDVIVISPRIQSGESGQIFKQVAIIAISVIASQLLTPAGGATIYSALSVAAVTIGAALFLNALIPPPTPNLGPDGLTGGTAIESSQMYSITGQSNQMRRLGIVPKVYGYHRIFPMLAATPYTELSVDPATGQTVQYLYAIYDCGLGVMEIGDIKIGDTPLTTESFRDFEMRFVDPNRPGTPEDEYDERLSREFRNYKAQRATTNFALAFNDGTEFIQFSDDNDDNLEQEIVLDMACPRGLYGFSSGGELGERNVQMEIHYALVGTSDWKAYNDLNHVDYYQSAGGSDFTTFSPKFAVPANFWEDNEYYITGFSTQSGGGFSNRIYTDGWKVLRPGTNKLLVEPDSRYATGARVFVGDVFIGYIQSISILSPSYTELTLDRTIDNATAPYAWMGQRFFKVYQYKAVDRGSLSYVYTNSVQRFITYKHENSVAVITGSSTNTVFANFKFKPKETGQFQVRVRRVSTYGQFSTQKQDDVTWTAISTSYISTPVTTTKRHMFIELKIKATNQLNGHIQNLSCIVQSVLPVYDPETETWTRMPTNNPAWVFCDLLTGEVNKKAVAVSRLHMDSIMAWAEYCDEIPASTPNYDYVQKRFECCFILDYETTLQGVLNQITSAAQAGLNIVDGKYGVMIDQFKFTPVQVFTPRNSRDFSSTRIYGPRPHGVKVKFIDPESNWEMREVIAYDNGYDEETATEFDELTSFACINHEQAWRFGRYMIAQNKLRQENISLLVDFENLICTRGDYVQITQDVMRVGGRPARVKSIETVTGFYGPYDLIRIDDSLDIDPDLDLGYVRRKADGDIITDVLSVDEGIETWQTITFSGIPTGGDIVFSYHGNQTDPIPYSDVNTVNMVFAIRELPFTDDLEFDLDTLSFRVKFAGVFSSPPPFPLEVFSNTLTDGGGDVDVTTEDYTEGTPPDSSAFIFGGDTPEVGELVVIGDIDHLVLDCIVKSISPNDDLSATLTLVEKADEIFDYESSLEIPEYNPEISETSSPDFKPPKAVTNLTVDDDDWECSEVKSGYNYFVFLTWDIPVGSVYEFFEIWMNDGRGYRLHDTTTSRFYRYNVEQSRLDIEHGFKVAAVSASGKKIELAAMPEVTVTPETKTEPPSDIDALNMSITNQVLQLSWPKIEDCDCAQYILRYSPGLNDVWESSVPLASVTKDVNSLSVQARTGVYMVKAVDYNGNESAIAAKGLTTIPNLFDLNEIETLNEAPDFEGIKSLVEALGEAIILQEEIPGDVDTVKYYDEGTYEYADIFDLEDVYTVRLQSLIRADGLKKDELMSEWESLEELEHLNTALASEWDVFVQYRATDIFAAMSSWPSLSVIDHINYGAGVGFTEWRDIPTAGDATGRIFQFRLVLISNAANVTPRVFDATIKADMPDRVDSFENQVSHPSEAYVINYDPPFKGPDTSPNVQISIDDAETGDYWEYDYKTLEGLAIRIYDKDGNQVSRQFDMMAKGFGHQHTTSL